MSRIDSDIGRLSWHQPSRHEEPLGPVEQAETVFVGTDAILDAMPEQAEEVHILGGRERGLVLHKLIEEVLTRETAENSVTLQARAAELLAQLGLEDAQNASVGPCSAEMAAAVERTLHLPEIAAVRSRLVPEFRVYASAVEDRAAILTAGIADAVAIEETGQIDVVVDWKSDVNPTAEQIEVYRKQLRDYLRGTGARTGLLVFLSSGRIEKIMVED